MPIHASYIDKSLDYARTIELHDEGLRVVGSRLQSDVSTIPLAALDPSIVRKRVHRSGFGTGLAFAAAALLVRWVLGLDIQSEFGGMLTGFVACGVVVALLRVRRVDAVAFRDRGGRTVLSITQNGPGDAGFGAFVAQVMDRIGAASAAAPMDDESGELAAVVRSTRKWPTFKVQVLRIAGVPVHLHASFFVVGLLVVALSRWAGWPIWLDFLFFALVIAVHEAGHAIAARWMGLRVHTIEITGGGGFCRVDVPPTSNRIALLYGAGMIAQLLLLAVAVTWLAAFADWTLLHQAAARILVGLNLFLALLCLVPAGGVGGMPSDGAVLWAVARHRFRGGPHPATVLLPPTPVFSRDTRLLDVPGFRKRSFPGGLEFLNDNTTPMDFVVDVLERHLGLDRDAAIPLMVAIHTKGGAVVPLADVAKAEAIARAIMAEATERRHGDFVCRAVAARQAVDDGSE